MHPAPPYASDALTRVGVSLVVPAVAVAAHGIAAGGAPHAEGVLISAGIGGLFALMSGVRRRSRVVAIASTTLLLTIAQVACHWAKPRSKSATSLAASGPGCMSAYLCTRS